MLNTTPYSEGNPATARLILIGEAPSHSEMSASRPFVGPAGKVLDRCLHQAGIARSECYLTNVFSEPLKKSRTAGAKSVWDVDEEDYFRLFECFKLLREDAIFVPLGSTALNLLCDQTEIMKYRGTPTPCTFERFSQSCIPTIHPAATLRGQFLWQYFIIADLKKAKRWSQGIKKDPERRFMIAPTFKESLDYLDHLTTVDLYAWDIEIFRNQISCISFAPSATEAISIPLINMHKQTKSYFSREEEVEIWKALGRTLSSPGGKIGQNLMFDASWMLHFHNVLMRGTPHDTMLAHSVMYPDFPKGLDFLCSIYTDMPYYKDDRKLWKKFGEDQERFWLYNARDSVYTFEVWEALQEELSQYQKTYQMTMDLFYPLLYMIERGLKVDEGKLHSAKLKIEDEARRKRAELVAIAEWDFNPASPKQCQEYFYITKGVKPYVNRATGKVSVDDKALQRLATTHQLREASLVQEIRYLEKLGGTYLDVELDQDKRLRCFWNPRGTTTGRLSSSKTLWGSGLNLQNLHPYFKEFIVSEEGQTDANA